MNNTMWFWICVAIVGGITIGAGDLDHAPWVARVAWLAALIGGFVFMLRASDAGEG